VANAGAGRHKVHSGFTLLLPLREDAGSLVAELFASYATTPPPFARSTTTHFATITVIPRQRTPARADEFLPATLLFATSISGPPEDHIAELVDLMYPELCVLFSHCQGFSIDTQRDGLAAFLAKHRHADTFYSGMQFLSKADVIAHQQLRGELQEYLDRHEAELAGLGALAVVAKLRAHLATTSFAWALAADPPAPYSKLVQNEQALIAIGILLGIGGAATCIWGIWGLLGTIGVLAAVVGGLAGLVRLAELEQEYVTLRPDDAHARSLAAQQLRPVINEFVIAGPVKVGAIRPLFSRLLLWVVARAAPHINIPTVATARWIAADGGKRLVFISNYTNDAEPYVRDFIDTRTGAMRINATFGFGRGYPKTKFVLWGGAVDDPDAFLYVVAEGQQRTGYWYGPYDDISIDNIKRARLIRDGVPTQYKTDEEAEAWLHLL